ncbi:uncharacterized protein LOC144987451 isoform X2 [Oryzias latipes]
MSSLKSLRELISERLAAAAEEICRLCEGTIVQYEEELCRQRRLLDVIWKPQLQLHHIVLPQHWMTEEDDLCNQQRNFKVEQEEPEPPQIQEEPGELCINQDEDQLDLKQETDTLMEIPTYEEDENSEADLNNQQSFNVTDGQDEEGNQHEESTSTTDEETDPQNRDQRKRRDRSHVQSVDSSHMSAGVATANKSHGEFGNVLRRMPFLTQPSQTGLGTGRGREGTREQPGVELGFHGWKAPQTSMS